MEIHAVVRGPVVLTRRIALWVAYYAADAFYADA